MRCQELHPSPRTARPPSAGQSAQWARLQGVFIAAILALLLFALLMGGIYRPASAHDTPPPPVAPLVLEEVTTARVFPRVLAPNPIVQSWLPYIDSRQLVTIVGKLSGEWPALIDGAPYTIATRHTDSGAPIFAAVRYVEEFLQKRGLSVVRYAWHATRPPNVIGQITGTVVPDVVYMITAHLDSTAPPGPAPGADDNASGSAAVLAAANILSAYEWSCTLRFALWTGEEQGLLGSRAYAAAARAANQEIKGVLNFDMIGWNSPDSPPDVDFHASSALTPTQELAQLMVDVVNVYNMDLIPQIVALGIGASDHASFWEQGYPAILGIEDYYPGRNDFNPYYHTANDRLHAFDVPYFTEFARAALAGFVHMSNCLATGALAGRVVHVGDAEPVPNARITLTHASGHRYTTTVDSLGRYSVTLPAGDYLAKAAADGFLDAGPLALTVGSGNIAMQDFALSRGAYLLTKTLLTADPLRPGQEARFVVQIANTGDAPIVSLSLGDNYPTNFLSFQGSQPPPDDSANDGALHWSSLPILLPGVTRTVTVTFRAVADTTTLPGGAAQNNASVEDVLVDGDGDGPRPAQSLPPRQSAASVRILSPTGVVVSSFSATAQTAGVVLSWITEDESDVAGYRLTRTQNGSAPIELTSAPIPARKAGSAGGSVYGFMDEGADAVTSYRYVLQIVGLDGAIRDAAMAATLGRRLFYLPAILYGATD